MTTIARGLASIIVPCRDQLTFTRECVRSLVRHTTPPWELVVVDDGCTDGTRTYLDGLQDTIRVPLSIVAHTQSQGFSTACNHGLAAARGDFLVLLNNDTVVTDGWLDQLVALAVADPKIGFVGPMSNYASPPQLIPNLPYQNLDEMNHFANAWRRERLGQWFTCEKLSGFCILIKRSVFEQIGGLDERFGIGFFDDDDLCLRARKAGYELAVAFDCFVHHFGSRTISSVGVDTEELLETNRAKFAEKWGEESLAGRRAVSIAPWTPAVAEEPSVALPPVVEGTARSARVSLTMIVKNEEKNLPNCLESVRDLFDEIVVLDTGSTDRTVEIARSFGARVFDFVWVNDFAAARNAALARATGDYAFWLDADDVFAPEQRNKFHRLIHHLQRGDEAAYVMRCACDPDHDGGGGSTVVDHVRLFPVREDVRWTYRVHEQILPALRRAGIPVRWTDVVIRHTGYTDPELRERKLRRDEAILMGELEEHPNEPFTLFNLGAGPAHTNLSLP
jgi:glycosyltransferase involved in cell wall biosynthesis